MNSHLKGDAPAGNPLLIEAIRQGEALAVQELLEAGADRNWVDQQQRNAIHHAAIKGDPTIMFLVLQYNCKSMNAPNIEALDQHRKKPIHYANNDVRRLLVEQRALNCCLCRAAKSGNLREFEKLLREGAYLSAQDKKGRKVIDLAFASGKGEVIGWLQKMGFDLKSKVDKRSESWLEDMRLSKFVSWGPLIFG